jgi:hypothetical protein
LGDAGRHLSERGRHRASERGFTMQRHDEHRGQQVGDFAFGRNYWRDQMQFFLSIEKEAPEALKALKKSVLPLYVTARPAQPGGKYPPRPRTREWELRITEPWRGLCPAGYDPGTWPAIWDWAGRVGLVRADELPSLKSEQAKLIACDMDESYWARCGTERREPFAPASPALVFHLRAVARVVLRTLRAWSNTSDLVELRWSFPEPDPTVYDGLDPEELAKRSQRDPVRDGWEKCIWMGYITPLDPPPLVYTFRPVQAWSMRRESRAQAYNRIMREVATQLRELMRQHERGAKYLGFNKHPRKVRREHFDWLALYQVRGWNNAEIARHVKKSWPAQGTSAAHLEQTVRDGIQTAARLVVGPSWRSWLRRGKSGRPKKPRP